MPRARKPKVTTKKKQKQVPAITRTTRRAAHVPHPVLHLYHIGFDAEGRPWSFEPRWPGDPNPWAFCG